MVCLVTCRMSAISCADLPSAVQRRISVSRADSCTGFILLSLPTCLCAMDSCVTLTNQRSWVSLWVSSSTVMGSLDLDRVSKPPIPVRVKEDWHQPWLMLWPIASSQKSRWPFWSRADQKIGLTEDRPWQTVGSIARYAALAYCRRHASG